jgi:hypothetical protein
MPWPPSARGYRSARLAMRAVTGLRGRTGGPRDLGTPAIAPSRPQSLVGGTRARQPRFRRQLPPVAEQHQDHRPECRNARRARARRHPRFPGTKAADHAAAVPASPSPDTTPPASRRAARPRRQPGTTDQKRSAQSRVSTRSPHRRCRPPAHHHRPYRASPVNPVIHMRRSGPRSGPRRARPYAISRGSTLCPGVKPQRRHAPKCGPAVRPVEQPGPG